MARSQQMSQQSRFPFCIRHYGSSNGDSSRGSHNTTDDQGPRDAARLAILSQIQRNSGTAMKSEDTGKKETVAVPELQRIQELHRVILTGVDVFAQARFPKLHLTGEGVSPHVEAFAFTMLICQQIQPGRRSLGGRPTPFRLYKFNSPNGVRFPIVIS